MIRTGLSSTAYASSNLFYPSVDNARIEQQAAKRALPMQGDVAIDMAPLDQVSSVADVPLPQPEVEFK